MLFETGFWAGAFLLYPRIKEGYKMKKRLPAAAVICAVALAAAGLVALAGCPSPTNGDPAPDKAALTAAIATANEAKSGVAASTDGSDIATTAYWATQDALTAFAAAIGAAETVSQNTAATQAEVDAAVTALTQATTTFNAAKSAGTKSETDPTVDKVALTAAIATANEAKSGVWARS
jgi:hypothetical protein